MLFGCCRSCWECLGARCPGRPPSPEALRRVPASQNTEQAEAPGSVFHCHRKLMAWWAKENYKYGQQPTPSNLNKRKVILAETVKYTRLAAEIKLL